VAVTALAIFTLFPELQNHLPRPDAWDDLFAAEGRAIGPLTNPNDLAYAAIALGILHGALLPGRPRLADRALLAVVLAAAAYCIVTSGSRSGFLGLAAAVAFFLASSRVSLSSRVAVLAAAATMLVAGLTYSAVFESRLTRAYQQGLQEENVYTRLDAQALAARTALVYPLGVGYTDFARVSARTGERAFTTSDSVYFDTLLGAGFLGLACLLALLYAAWRHISRTAGASSRRGAVLKGGLVAFLFFGTATVVPISVFLSPLFFSIVGAAAYADGDETP
jgi:O-antigen ligase